MPSECVVFVHGNPGSARGWDGLLAAAQAAVGAVLAPTMPGFASAPIPSAFECTVDGYAAWLGERIDEAGIDRAHLVMHDFGGPFGLTWGAAHPERVASVTCIDTGVLVDYHWHALARIWRTPVLGEVFNALSTRTAFGILLRRGQPQRLPKAAVDAMYEDFGPAARRTVTRLYRATDEALLARFGPVYRDLDPPALVLWGAHDPYLPVAQAHRQLEAFPSAQVVVLEASGHWPQIDDPQGVLGHLAPFLRKSAHVR